MTGENGAGRSAEEESKRLRRQIDHLEARAQRFEQGARGEQRTATVLNPRSGDGWHVLHDLAIPASKANIDHVVITPAGVFVVDSKNWNGYRISDGNGTLWVGKYPKRNELATLEYEVNVVGTALSASLPGWQVPVRGVVSLTGTRPMRPVLTAGATTAVAVDYLVGHLNSHPTRLSPEHTDAIARAIDRSLPSRTGARSSLVEPDPLPPRPTEQAPASFAAPVTRRQTVRPKSADGPPPRTPNTYQRRRQDRDRALQDLARVGAGLLVCVVALVVLPKMIHDIHISTPKIPARSPTAKGTPTTVAVPAVKVSWTCLNPAKSWTATFAWPPGVKVGGSTEIATAATSSGPWHLQKTGEGADPFQLEGIPPGTHEWVRAGSIVSLEISGTAIMSGPITAPAGC